MFFCEFCEIAKSTIFTEHLWMTASVTYFISFHNLFISLTGHPLKRSIQRTQVQI